ncbi:MAG: hypothetical protein MJ055_06015 [Phascolarctobacterium sp.]|nr:hypothetical protein [Phascolarctobacterium sp.]
MNSELWGISRLKSFVLKYAQRCYPEVKKVQYETSWEPGARCFHVYQAEEIYVESTIENARISGIKVGSQTTKMLCVPLIMEELVYKDGWYQKVAEFKMVGKESFKHEPRVIVKNALNDIINYFTSPNANYVRGSIFNPEQHKQDRGSIRW